MEEKNEDLMMQAALYIAIGFYTAILLVNFKDEQEGERSLDFSPLSEICNKGIETISSFPEGEVKVFFEPLKQMLQKTLEAIELHEEGDKKGFESLLDEVIETIERKPFTTIKN